MRYLLLFVILAFSNTTFAQKDIVLFDFESGNLNGWTVVGKNPFYKENPVSRNDIKEWGRGPVGFQGNYYLESGAQRGRHNNNPDGILQSPEFVISRKFLNFYIAGEVHPNVRVFLEVDGKTVCEAHGNNFYDLMLRGWNVEAYSKKKARFCIEDQSLTPSLLRVDHIYLSNTPSPQESTWVKGTDRQRSSIVCPGEFKPIVKASDLGPDFEIDHATVVCGPDKKWHLYASVLNRTDRWNSGNWKNIIHATSDNLNKIGWKYEGIVMTADPAHGEDFIWQPHVVFENGLYYMFYVGAGREWTGWYPTPSGEPASWFGGHTGDIGPFWMYVATSADGKTWERKGDFLKGRKGCIFVDKPFAFHPYVSKINNQWVMYYGGCETENVLGKHAVVYRTSDDLIHWSGRKIALPDWRKDDPKEASLFDEKTVPSSPWPEHSFFQFPAVFNRGSIWYMWAGPIDNNNLSRYHALRIFKSDNPYSFGKHWEAVNVNKRIFVDGGAKPIRDTDGKWYIYTTNLHSGGVWLAPLYWNDGMDQEESSVIIPK